MGTLLAALVLGATVSLLAVLLSQANSRSMQAYSRAVMEMALANLDSKEASLSRDRTLTELTRELEKLNLVVGQLYLKVNNRTVLDRAPQVGEAPPNSPTRTQIRTETPQEPLEPEGWVETTTSSPTPRRARVTAFAEPT
jgi:hypothetical protein